MRRNCLRKTNEDIVALRREAGDYANACALQLDATRLFLEQGPSASIECLDKAIRAFAREHMDAHAHALIQARGKLLGAKHGATDLERALNWMARQGVEAPEQIGRIFAPALSLT